MKRTLPIALALSFACSMAFADASLHTRGDALMGLASDDATNRAEAAAWIAGNGSGEDSRLLVERLVDDSPAVREVAEQGLWMLWAKSGDEVVDNLMARGVGELQSGQVQDALATFSEVIDRKPEFAEAFNQRAMVLFMVGDFKKSLDDCNEVIKRNPQHFGALAGFGQIYFRQEQYAKAISYWKKALEINPHMPTIQRNIKAAEDMMKIGNTQMT